MLTDLFDEIAERGWFVNNLYQLDSGSWRANLRTADLVTDFGQGTSPAEALSAALDALAFHVEPTTPAFTLEPSRPRLDINTLFGREPFKRRYL